MVENIAIQIRKALKDHTDDNREFIEESFDWLLFNCTQSEIKAINNLRKNNWLIKKGDIYEKQYNKTDGKVYTFNTLPIIQRICIKYKLYDGIC